MKKQRIRFELASSLRFVPKQNHTFSQFIMSFTNLAVQIQLERNDSLTLRLSRTKVDLVGLEWVVSVRVDLLIEWNFVVGVHIYTGVSSISICIVWFCFVFWRGICEYLEHNKWFSFYWSFYKMKVLVGRKVVSVSVINQDDSFFLVIFLWSFKMRGELSLCSYICPL